MHLSLKSSLGRQILTGIYVKDNRVLDLTTPFSELTFTLEDKSGEGNDATLYSGRYISTDGSTDRGIVADCSAAGAGNYYLTGKVRPNAVTTAELTMDGSTDSGLTGLTADVWQTFTTATSAVTPSAVQVGYDGSTASAADWSDVKLIDSSDGSTVARWQLNESADGDLNGYPALDSSGNGYHGTHTGCAGGTGETTILQTAGMDWNKGKVFNGVDSAVTASGTSGTATGTFSAWLIMHADPASNTVYFGKRSTGNFEGAFYRNATHDIAAYLKGANVNLVLTQPLGVPVHLAMSRDSGSNVKSYVNGTLLSTDSSTFNIGHLFESIGSSVGVSAFSKIIPYDVRFYGGTVLSDADIAAIYNRTSEPAGLTNRYLGVGSTPWDDTVGAVNGTEAGTFSNLLIPASDSTPSNDALGNAIANPRPTADTWNLFGDGEYGRVADADSLDVTTEATWEIWGNFYGQPPNSYFVLGKASGASSVDWGFQNNSTAVVDRIRFYFNAYSIFTQYQNVPDAVTHICLTYSSGAVACYFNGVLQSPQAIVGVIPASLNTSTSNVLIGFDPITSNTGDDQISRPKIYNRALTADEVLKNFNAQKSSFGL